MKRREFIRQSSLLLGAAVIPQLSFGNGESQLIYLSPVKSNGALSRCQAEVWFAQDAADMYVVTANDAWRAEAVARGLRKAQVWVGDVGQWQSADGSYKNLPSVMADVAQIDDPAEHTRVLASFGAKYTREWGTWGPRFKKGLADGSRVLLRYRPA